MKRKTRHASRKINKYKIRRMIALLCMLLLIVLIIGVIRNMMNKHKEIPLSVLYDNQLLTMQKEILMDDQKNIWMSKEDVQKIFDETIYYNEAEKELITTYNKHTASLKVDDSNMIVNDSNMILNATLREVEGTIYLPIKELGIVYDIEIEYCEPNNRIIIDSTAKEKVQATLLKSANLKEKKGWFKKTTQKMNLGDTVIVLETDKNYKKIRTTLGNIGYVKANKLTNETKLRESMIDEVYTLKTYPSYSNISGIYDKVQLEEGKLNVVIPTFFYLDKNSRVLDKTTSSTATYANYTNWVNENGLSILPTLKNNESVSSTLLTYAQRDEVISALYTYIVKYQYKGINVNFETIDDINSFYRLIIEMTPRFKESGLIVAVTLNENIDKAKILKITDYIIEE